MDPKLPENEEKADQVEDEPPPDEDKKDPEDKTNVKVPRPLFYQKAAPPKIKTCCTSTMYEHAVVPTIPGNGGVFVMNPITELMQPNLDYSLAEFFYQIWSEPCAYTYPDELQYYDAERKVAKMTRWESLIEKEDQVQAGALHNFIINPANGRQTIPNPFAADGFLRAKRTYRELSVDGVVPQHRQAHEEFRMQSCVMPRRRFDAMMRSLQRSHYGYISKVGNLPIEASVLTLMAGTDASYHLIVSKSERLAHELYQRNVSIFAGQASNLYEFVAVGEALVLGIAKKAEAAAIMARIRSGTPADIFVKFGAALMTGALVQFNVTHVGSPGDKLDMLAIVTMIHMFGPWLSPFTWGSIQSWFVREVVQLFLDNTMIPALPLFRPATTQASWLLYIAGIAGALVGPAAKLRKARAFIRAFQPPGHFRRRRVVFDHPHNFEAGDGDGNGVVLVTGSAMRHGGRANIIRLMPSSAQSQIIAPPEGTGHPFTAELRTRILGLSMLTDVFRDARHARNLKELIPRLQGIQSTFDALSMQLHEHAFNPDYLHGHDGHGTAFDPDYQNRVHGRVANTFVIRQTGQGDGWVEEITDLHFVSPVELEGYRSVIVEDDLDLRSFPGLYHLQWSDSIVKHLRFVQSRASPERVPSFIDEWNGLAHAMRALSFDCEIYRNAYRALRARGVGYSRSTISDAIIRTPQAKYWFETLQREERDMLILPCFEAPMGQWLASWRQRFQDLDLEAWHLNIAEAGLELGGDPDPGVVGSRSLRYTMPQVGDHAYALAAVDAALYQQVDEKRWDQYEKGMGFKLFRTLYIPDFTVIWAKYTAADFVDVVDCTKSGMWTTSIHPIPVVDTRVLSVPYRQERFNRQWKPKNLVLASANGPPIVTFTYMLGNAAALPVMSYYPPSISFADANHFYTWTADLPATFQPN